jgi:hypothetical protein
VFSESGRKSNVAETTLNIHSLQDLSRPEAKRVRVKLADLNIPEIDLVEVLLDALVVDALESKNLADEHPVFMPADVAAVVLSSKHESMRIDEFDRISRHLHRIWLINAAWPRMV